jgi:bifunctional non-homologous end joining protein LigD
VKWAKQQDFVIAGYTPSSKGPPGFGSFVLGVYEKGKLIYAGRVGTGFTFKQHSNLKRQLDKLSRQISPLAAVTKDPGLRETKWTEPKMIAEVAFTEWTSDGAIRHSSFQGLREDKNPKEVVREVTTEKSRAATRARRKSSR